MAPADVRIAGTGSYLPGPALDQDTVRRALRQHPDGLSATLQERVLHESGIVTRHFAIDVDDPARRETNVSMAAAAGRKALAAACWSPEDVDLLVVTTVMPDRLMPATSTLVQEVLGIPRCAELEIAGNCAAPFKALAFAASQLRLREHSRALVCCSQYVSFLGCPPWSNPARMAADQGHLRWILSDGAAAIALEVGRPDVGLRVWLESSGYDKEPGMSLSLGASAPDLRRAFDHGDHHIAQNPRRVLREVMSFVPDAMNRMLRAVAVDPTRIDHFIPAVSSVQLARKLQERLEDRCAIPASTWRLNFMRVGYLGGVTFPFTLDELIRSGTLRRGETICAVAEESSKWISAGAVLRWNPPPER